MRHWGILVPSSSDFLVLGGFLGGKSWTVRRVFPRVAVIYFSLFARSLRSRFIFKSDINKIRAKTCKKGIYTSTFTPYPPPQVKSWICH